MNGAVILGDLIGSRQHTAPQLDRAMQALAETADALGSLTGQSHFTRYRGDGWQLATGRPEMALRLAVALSARLIADGGPATRVAIGIGEIESLAGGELGAASGSAFLRSGQMLDQMSPRRRLVLAGAPAGAAPWIDAQLHLIEYIAERWSAAQAQALVLALSPGWDVQADLAAKLGVTRQAMQVRLKGAGYSAITSALTAFEGFDWTRPHG